MCKGEKVKKYWIKTNLHKDGTPLWHGVTGETELKCKMSELRALGYKPVIDRSITGRNLEHWIENPVIGHAMTENK